MRRTASALGVAMLLTGSLANAGELDPIGSLVPDKNASLSVSFDGPNALANLPIRRFTVSDRSRGAVFVPAGNLKPEAFTPDAIEGTRALKLEGDEAILLGDQASLAKLAQGRNVFRLFAKAEGALPEVRALYTKGNPDAARLSFPTAAVTFIRTGRATSDGWVEYSSGPIDGTAGSSALSGILILAGQESKKGGQFLIDALEAVPVPGPLLSGATCTSASEARVCASGAVCVEGRCLDSALIYGALPTKEARLEIVARVKTYFTRFQGDRAGAEYASQNFAKDMGNVAQSATTPDAFFRQYFRSLARTRAAHTSAPEVATYSFVSHSSAAFSRYYGTELGACFGIVEKDLSGGGHGAGVYSVSEGSPLRIGDVIVSVDGAPLTAFIESLLDEGFLHLTDPDSDLAYASTLLSGFLMRNASELEVERCSSPEACTGADVTRVKLDLAQLRKNATTATNTKPLRCSIRFKLGVNVPAGLDIDAYESAVSEEDRSGIVTFLTNGEPVEGDSTWKAAMNDAFGRRPSRMIIDKRRGDGGGGDSLAAYGKLIRRDPEVGLFFVDRISHESINGSPGFLDELFGKCTGSSRTGLCALSSFEGHSAGIYPRPAKIAWLNVLDGSASDMATLYAKGVPGVRIFAPNRTLGLFGSLGVMAPILPGWSGGSVQFGDTRSGNTPEERIKGVFRSGTGIEPDEVTAQTQSDLLRGRDTMLERARAWLGE